MKRFVLAFTVLVSLVVAPLRAGQIIGGDVYGGGTFVTWDPATVAAVNLSGGNLVGTNTGTTSANQGMHTPFVNGKASGKFYHEITFTTAASTTGSNYGSGVGREDSTFTSMGGSSQVGSMVYKSGNMWINNSNSGKTFGARAAGDVIGVATDIDNGKIYYKVVSGTPSNWNATVGADPATNTGGLALPSIAGGHKLSIFSTFGGIGGVASDVQTLNPGSSPFVGAVPSGFTAGWTQ